MRLLILSLVVSRAVGLSTTPDSGSLVRRAAALRRKDVADFAAAADFAFDSLYTKGDERRGWSNWLLKERLMLGQYPHCQPAEPGPSAADAQAHLRRVLSAGVDCFVSLQDELPPQDAAWPPEGVRLTDPAARDSWPAPFVNYAADANQIASELGVDPVTYLHVPIVDLSVPRSVDPLFVLLDQILAHYEGGGGSVYIHCWGGRGRAGLVGGCLLALFREELDADAVLSTVQAAYDSRVGAAGMPSQLKRSPQTEAQRRFVRSIVSSFRAQRRFDNDMEMVDAGMPRGFT